MSKTNIQIKQLINDLDGKQSKLLSRVASDLNKSSRRRREVNLSRINHYTKENDVIIVPGKVLGGGDLTHKITISAYKFSQSAVEKLKSVGSTIVPIKDLSKESITGKKVKIIG